MEGIGIILLLSVVGQGLAGYLASGDTATIGEGGNEERVYVRLTLKRIEHRLHAFVNKGDGADLNADHGVAARCLGGQSRRF